MKRRYIDNTDRIEKPDLSRIRQSLLNHLRTNYEENIL
jgi:hypothetical protein